uniref:Neurotransmitter-gated ion-channel ligand-binding domain-containing protein n=1 Tax=Romanomermis culicivorax TaxID=13658 RepID=A0A915J467_ROMCU
MFVKSFILLVLFIRNSSVHCQTTPSLRGDSSDQNEQLGGRTCPWLKKGLVSKYARINRKMVEQCLLDDIGIKFQKTTGSSMTDPPPVTWRQGGRTVSDTFSQHDRVTATIYLSWFDSRLQWDQNEWLLKTVSVNDVETIWLPESRVHDSWSSILGGGGSIDILRKESKYAYANTVVESSGRVTTKFVLTEKADCEIDEYLYPSESGRCCVDIGRGVFNEIRDYQFAKGEKSLQLYGEQLLEDWSIKNAQLRLQTTETLSKDSEQQPVAPLKLCFEVHRTSPAVRAVLTLPLTILAFFVISSIFLSTMKSQIVVKMASLLLNVACFEMLMRRNALPEIMTVKSRVVCLYELTICVTIASFVITVFFVCLSKKRSINIIPPYRLQIFADYVHRFWYFSLENVDEQDSTQTNGSNEAVGVPKNFILEWRYIFSALNCFFSLLLIIVYVSLTSLQKICSTGIRPGQDVHAYPHLAYLV